LSAVIAEHGGNWLESRMARLGGQFAGILRVELPVARKEQALAALRELTQEGLTVSVHEATAGQPGVTAPLVTLAVVGHDRPGIVRQISQVLAAHQVNVEELTTFTESAAMSGETHFHAAATVKLPATCTLVQLRQALEAIATDLMVDITVAPETHRP
jgi:glycine cleavage system regulatory protein